MAEFASKGVAGTGLGFGIAGTALGLINGGLGNLVGNANMNTTGCATNFTQMCCSENTPITRYELEMALTSAAKDSKIALLEANIFTDSKINQLGNRTLDKFNQVESELREVAVYQGVNTATISCLKGQVEQLASLTKLVVPSHNVCNQDYPVIVTNTACNPVYTQAATK